MLSGNRILDALQRSDGDAPLLRSATVVPAEMHHVLFEPGDRPEFVWFPRAGAVVSSIQVFSDGAAIEAGLLGEEGSVGMELLLGAPEAMGRAMVQMPGELVRVPLAAAAAEFEQGGALQHALLEFAASFLAQVAQVAACNRLHTVPRRLARWILMMADRSGSSRLPLTQDTIGQMLGARRAGVNVALAALTARGAVRRSRGVVVIADRKALEAASCECYGRLAREFRRVA